MTSARTRKKQPALVRRKLLDCAAELAVEQGLAAVTVQAVAAAAGVTKGGFFHHFPTKQALAESVFLHLLHAFDAEIEETMAGDSEPLGRFTRAYVACTFAECSRTDANQRAALFLSMFAEARLRQHWAAWLNERLERHRETDGLPMQTIARLTADGIWLAYLAKEDGGPAPGIEELKRHLDGFSRSL